MESNLRDRIEATKQSLKKLKLQIEEAHQVNKTSSIADEASSRNVAPRAIKMSRVRDLMGHFGKVYAVHWAGDSVHLVSASQDGKLIVWNGITTWKVQSIALKSQWVMTCGYEQTEDRLVACGGLDNLCSIYQLGETSQPMRRANKELSGHDGYISSCRFVSGANILTSSGDATCNYWDIDRATPINRFIGHTADVMSLATSPVNRNLFSSASCDQTVRVWDIRTGKCTHTFRGHESDINSIAYFPEGHTVGTGSDDSTCRLFDLRCYNEVAVLSSERVTGGITSVQFSKSGRFLFSGSEDGCCRAWDITRPRGTAPACSLSDHDNKISSLAINPRGDALCSASWDTTIKIWA